MKKLVFVLVLLTVALLSRLTISVKASDDPTFLFQFGSFGSGNGQLNQPLGIAVGKNGNIYVVEGENYRISVFNSSGSYLFSFGAPGPNPGQFNGPRHITTDNNGNVYVTDDSNYNVSVFNSAGQFLYRFGELGIEPGKLRAPRGIAIDSSNRLFISDDIQEDVNVFSTTGNYLFRFGNYLMFSAAAGVDFDSNGNVYVADVSLSKVAVFNGNGTFLREFGTFGSGPGQLWVPVDVAVKGNEKVYVTDFRNHRLQIFDTSGNFVSSFAPTGDQRLDGPYGIDLDESTGRLYVTDRNLHRVEVFQAFSPSNPPVALDDSLVTSEDVAATINVAANDSDVDGDLNSNNVSVVTNPAHGILANNSNGQFTYTPTLNFNGLDSFSYQICDGVGLCDTATVSITVNPVNDTAIANSQAVATDEDTPLSIALQAGDVDGDPLTFSIVTSPANGALTGTAPNLIYTPNVNFFGNDSFSFKVNDGTVDSNIATVGIVVRPVNDPPIANDQLTSTNEDVPSSITLAATDVDGDALTFSILTPPLNGTLTGTAPNLIYTPNVNFFGNDSFSFKVNDGKVDSNIATVNIAINSVNDAPVCSNVTGTRDFLWPPDGQLYDVNIHGVTDIENDPITISITSIFQDEPTSGTGVNDVAPDGQGIGTSTAFIRAERDGILNGRMYHIGFSATDSYGATCSGSITVGVLHDQGPKGQAVDNGAVYNSTLP